MAIPDLVAPAAVWRLRAGPIAESGGDEPHTNRLDLVVLA
jgi:hypothetical protein